MDTNFSFDEIRPYHDSEIQEAFASLITDEEFINALQGLYPGITAEQLSVQTADLTNKEDFQMRFLYPLMQMLINKASTGLTYTGLENIDSKKAYLFLTNHRDIVLDSAFLNYILMDQWHKTTEIAIGDNLLIRPWIRTIVRLNKSFIIERNAPIRQLMTIFTRQSAYIHHTIATRNQSIWLAQREGRAKDSNDCTQESLLKMLAMNQEGTFTEAISPLHICPVSISYEYDPCDYLKAQEFQQKRDDDTFKKSPKDDLLSMKQGILGHKGHIHYHFGGDIQDEITELQGNKNELVSQVASIIDQRIHRGYRIYAGNRVAYDLLLHSNKYVNDYTTEEKVRFEGYLAQQLQKIQLPNADIPYLRQKMLEMYANPLINKEKANE